MKILTNICSNNLQKSKNFYIQLLGFKVKYDSDWYVQLCSPVDSEIEYGIIQRTHELVPTDYQSAPGGMYVTFVVVDVDAVYKKGLVLLQLDILGYSAHKILRHKTQCADNGYSIGKCCNTVT